MRLNLGCGRAHLAGFVNVDLWAACSPDEVCDLEKTPWPWEDEVAAEVVMHHVLEHLGSTPAAFVNIMRELYRVMCPGALLWVTVPHPRSDNFLADPTHVRPILPMTLRMFSRKECEKQTAEGGAMTPLALIANVDFEPIGRVCYGWSDLGMSIAPERRELAAETQFNVATEISMTLRRV